jgi:hypothetical protein
MKTAAYTICKNEINRIEQWIHYSKDFDYRAVLDTGSTDGTYEVLKKVPGIILDQKTPNPETFRYDIYRNINLNMIPEDVDWCLSPDIDEYYSINVLEEIEKTEKQNPEATCIACARLDIYSKKVFVGRPSSIGTNKIHRRHLYDWKQPVYEHISYIGPNHEREVYNYDIFLIHDQEVDKPRSIWYPKYMKREYIANPLNAWNNWFLANHYYQEKDLPNFVEVGLNFLRSDTDRSTKYQEILGALTQISRATNVANSIRNEVSEFLTTQGLI